MSEMIVKFKRPYKFEGKEYTELDLSGLSSLTVQDVIDAQKELIEQGNTAALGIIESTVGFAMALATKATKKPVELFKLMPRALMNQVQQAVMKAMSGEKNDVSKHVLTLEQPYTYDGKKGEIKGQTFDSIDLTEVENLCTMNELTAENRMVAEGFATVNKDRNYFHAVVIASQATGLPEDFFTALPLCEAAKLRNAVDSAFSSKRRGKGAAPVGDQD